MELINTEEGHKVAALQELLDKTLELKAQSENGISCVDEVKKVIEDSNALMVKANSSDIAVLDAKLLQMGCTILKNSVDTMNSNLSEFKPAVYAEHILNYLSNDLAVNSMSELDWSQLEKDASGCFARAPNYKCMLGSFDTDDAKPVLMPRATQNREHTIDVKSKKPTEVSLLESEEINIEERIRLMLPILRNAYRKSRAPIPYFTFVINPDDFSETVENIFIVSHMLGEGLATVESDSDGVPVIRPMAKSSREAPTMKKSNQYHFIVALTQKTWKDLKEVYEITTSMIPPSRRNKDK